MARSAEPGVRRALESIITRDARSDRQHVAHSRSLVASQREAGDSKVLVKCQRLLNAEPAHCYERDCIKRN